MLGISFKTPWRSYPKWGGKLLEAISFDNIITRSCEYPYPFTFCRYFILFFKPNVANKNKYGLLTDVITVSLFTCLPNVARLSQVIYLTYFTVPHYTSHSFIFLLFGQFIKEIFEDFLIIFLMSSDNATQRVIPNLFLWICSQYNNYKGWVSTFFLSDVWGGIVFF